MVRFTLADFPNPATVQILDLSPLASGALSGFNGGFATSTHGYLVPHLAASAHSGLAARWALNDFSTTSVETVDFTAVNANAKSFYGARV